MDSDTRRRRGQAAEDLAAGLARAKGLELVARNFRCRAGELDLVCRGGGLLIVIEVRLRRHPRFGGAAASVDAAKQCRILRATQVLLLREPRWRRLRLRFDVIAVSADADGTPRVEWIRDAFRPG